MTRQRFIHPDIWTDEVFAYLPPLERLMFIGCFSLADDEGRLSANPIYLRNAIFPCDSLTPGQVQQMRDDLVSKFRNLVLYQVNGTEYLAFRNWRQYQHPKYVKPSRIPPPPETSNGQPTATVSQSPQPNIAEATQEPPAEQERVELSFGLESGQNLTGIGPELEQNPVQIGTKSDPNLDQTGAEPGPNPVQLGTESGQNPVPRVRDWDSDLGLGAVAKLSKLRDIAISRYPERGKGVIGENHSPTLTQPNASQTRSPPRKSADEDATERELEIMRVLESVPGYPFDRAKDLQLVRLLSTDFPALDLLAEVKKWRTYKLDEPLTPKSRPRSQLRNWCEIAMKGRFDGRDGRGARRAGCEKGGSAHPRDYRSGKYAGLFAQEGPGDDTRPHRSRGPPVCGGNRPT